jgi:arylsulfatase
MEAAGISVPEEYNSVKQQPMDGVSLLYSVDAPDAANKKTRQYYEMFGNRAIWVDGWKAVTLHANRMPWELNKVLPFENDVWELYNVAEDYSESNDLAEQHPEKLAELQKIFDEEAWKYNVYPLYDDMIRRLGAQQDRLFGDQKDFLYFAPGAVRIAEKSSAPVKNRSHYITTTIDLKGNEQGVIAAVGGMTGGYTMFIKDGKLHYDYNFLDGLHYNLTSATLPKGKTELKFVFTKTKEFGGDGELYINGEKVDEVHMPQMHIATYSLAETFDIGMDTGTQVSRLYTDPFPFEGEIDRVLIRLTD